MGWLCLGSGHVLFYLVETTYQEFCMFFFNKTILFMLELFSLEGMPKEGWDGTCHFLSVQTRLTILFFKSILACRWSWVLYKIALFCVYIGGSQFKAFCWEMLLFWIICCVCCNRSVLHLLLDIFSGYRINYGVLILLLT